jgi:hypothetical protein
MCARCEKLYAHMASGELVQGEQRLQRRHAAARDEDLGSVAHDQTSWA